MNNQQQKKKHLRIGRVYHITPDPIPPQSKKGREAVYLGKIQVKGTKMNLFLQMGSSKYEAPAEFHSLYKELDYFWKGMGRVGYFHLGSSKPEHPRVVDNVYTKNGKYIEMKTTHAKVLKDLWVNHTESQIKSRWLKAYGFFLTNNRSSSLKQLNILKYTSPWTHKHLKPTVKYQDWIDKQKNDSK